MRKYIPKTVIPRSSPKKILRNKMWTLDFGRHVSSALTPGFAIWVSTKIEMDFNILGVQVHRKDAEHYFQDVIDLIKISFQLLWGLRKKHGSSVSTTVCSGRIFCMLQLGRIFWIWWIAHELFVLETL